MKWIFRFFFAIASLLSLLVCMASATMWVRSRYVGDQIAWNNAMGRTRQIDSCAGTLQFGELNSPPAKMPFTSSAAVVNHRPIPANDTWRVFWGVEPSDVVWEAAGFALLCRSYIVYPPGGSTGYSGFGGGMPVPSGTATLLAFVIPYWFIVLITSILPIRAAIRWQKYACAKRRVKAGCCVVCGYDLRATPDRCPECGTAVAKPAEPA